MYYLAIDWESIFSPEFPMLEIFIRGTVLYIGILILMRFMPRRTGAELGLMDLIFVLLITEAASHSQGDFSSVFDGILMILVFVFWDYFFNFVSYRVPFISKLLNSPPLIIIKNGRLNRRNMRKEFLTEDELMSNLRKKGIEEVSQVKLAFIEGEGEISIIEFSGPNKEQSSTENKKEE